MLLRRSYRFDPQTGEPLDDAIYFEDSPFLCIVIFGVIPLSIFDELAISSLNLFLLSVFEYIFFHFFQILCALSKLK